MKAKRRDGDMVYFDFVCPGCEAAGELGIDTKDGMKPFRCPEGCGAIFVPWERLVGWELRCVVQPVHGRPAVSGRRE